VMIDGVAIQGVVSNQTGVQSLWHDNVGYTFPSSSCNFSLSVDVGVKSGNWSAIGTSTQPPTSVDLFAAWITHENADAPLSYSVFPATDLDTFSAKSLALNIQEIQNDEFISAVFDETYRTASIVFWDALGGSAYFVPSPTEAGINITSNSQAGVIYRLNTGIITVSDPSQTLVSVRITLTLDDTGSPPAHWGNYSRTKILSLDLPSGGLAGSSVSSDIQNL